MSNWSRPTHFQLFSERAPRVKEVAPPTKSEPKKPEPIKVQAKPKPTPPPPTENLDAMLQSIDADLALCSKTPPPLKIAVKAPDHPFYARLKSAIAAHIGEVVDEGADLVLGPGGDIELLEPEAYTPEKKRALWDELKKRAHRQ